MKMSREQYHQRFEEEAIDELCEKAFESGRCNGGDVDPCEYILDGEVEELLDDWYEDYLYQDSEFEKIEQRNI